MARHSSVVGVPRCGGFPLRLGTAILLIICFCALSITDVFHLHSNREEGHGSAFSMSAFVAAVDPSGEHEWEKPGGGVIIERNCEVCQMMVEVAREKMETKLKGARMQKGYVDVIVDEVVQPEELCGYSGWSKYDGLSEWKTYDLTATCERLLADMDELLEKKLAKGYKSPTLTSDICVKQMGYCSAVWTEVERPENREKGGDRNKRLGKAFLEFNRTQPGVKETESGLQYKEIKSPEGSDRTATPTANNDVSVHYTGKLLNGKIFDSSRKTGKPAEFSLNSVVSGWKEGLQLMHEGSTFELFVPSHLAYGERGPGGDIGPNETLVFEVELLKILRKGKTADPEEL